MKKSLLATVAAVALIAGAGMASAEGMKDQPKAGAAETHAPAAAQKAEPEMKRGADVKSGADVKGKAAERKGGKAETTGAGANESGMSTERGPNADSNDVKRDTAPRGQGNVKPNAASENMDQKAAPAGKSAADEKAGSGMSKSTASEKPSSAQTAAPAGKTGGSANLTTEQKTKIRTTVLQSGPKVSRSSINFNISVGTVVPRSVHFVTVPTTIVEVYPEYRGFEYFVVDEQVIILDPHSLKIVAVLDV